MKTLVIYYSYGGNTRKAAEKIQNAIGGGADLAEIETMKPYMGSYQEVVDQGQREVNSGFSPEIKPISVDMSDYDKIVIGTPVWWYTYAPAVKTFLEQTDFTGKQVFPFATNGGWIGHTFQDFKNMCGHAEVKEGLNIRFNGEKQLTKDSEILAWAKKI